MCLAKRMYIHIYMNVNCKIMMYILSRSSTLFCWSIFVTNVNKIENKTWHYGYVVMNDECKLTSYKIEVCTYNRHICHFYNFTFYIYKELSRSSVLQSIVPWDSISVAVVSPLWIKATKCAKEIKQLTEQRNVKTIICLWNTGYTCCWQFILFSIFPTNCFNSINWLRTALGGIFLIT